MSGPFKPLLAPLRRLLTPGKAHDIGVHIGRERLNLMQFQPGQPRPTIRAAASLKHGTTRHELIADPTRLKELIKRAFAEQPFHGKRVVTCLPNDQVRMLLLNYTVADGETESAAVVRELRERVHEELDGMVVDYIPVRQELASRPKEAIVAMAARDEVMTYLDLLAKAGLQVASLDVSSAALARLMAWIDPLPTAKFPNLLLINFGAQSSYLTVVWGQRLMLDRPIEFGEQRLLARLKSILGMSESEALRLLLERGLATGSDDDKLGESDNDIGDTLREVLQPEFAALKAQVHNTLIYTASRTHGRSVDGIYVLGSIVRYPGIEKLLEKLLGEGLPLKILDPCAIFQHRLNDQQLCWLWPRSGVAAAAGLALRGVPLACPTST